MRSDPTLDGPWTRTPPAPITRVMTGRRAAIHSTRHERQTSDPSESERFSPRAGPGERARAPRRARTRRSGLGPSPRWPVAVLFHVARRSAGFSLIIRTHFIHSFGTRAHLSLRQRRAAASAQRAVGSSAPATTARRCRAAARVLVHAIPPHRHDRSRLPACFQAAPALRSALRPRATRAWAPAPWSASGLAS